MDELRARVDFRESGEKVEQISATANDLATRQAAALERLAAMAEKFVGLWPEDEVDDQSDPSGPPWLGCQ